MYFYVTFASIILGLVTLLYLWWTKVKKYWADRDIPYLPPTFFMGNMTFLLKENMANWLERVYQYYDSPYVGFWIFWRPGLLVNSPAVAKNILNKDFNIFKNRFMSSGNTDPVGAMIIFTAKDPFWSNIRRQLNGLFTSAKLRHFQYYTRIKSKELVQRINNDRNTKIDILALFIDYTTDVIGTSLFGIKSNATLTGAGPLREIAKDFSKYSLFRSVGWFSIFFIPDLVDIFRFKFFPKSSIEYFRKIFDIITSKRENNEEDKDTKDLVDFLINIKKENESFSDDIIVGQAAIILFGGFDTSARTLTFIVSELAHNLDIQEKLYQELSEAALRKGNDDFDVTTFSELPYLNGVIKEILRLYSPMGWIERVASEDYKIDDKLTVEAGTVVYINAIGMQKDPKYFSDPHKFDPERFLPENKHNIEPFTYLPFGDGPRACIGKRFGYMTVQFALAHMLLKNKILAYPDSPKPSEIKISANTVWYVPSELLCVQFVPR